MESRSPQALLDDGGTALMRILAGFIGVGVVGLIVIVAAPLMLLVATFGQFSPPTSPSPAPPTDHSPQPPDRQPLGPPGGIVEAAYRYLGVPYVFGGTNP